MRSPLVRAALAAALLFAGAQAALAKTKAKARKPAAPAKVGFTYGQSRSNIDELEHGNVVVDREVSYEPSNKSWWLHANFEGQVLVDGKPQVSIDRRPRGPKNKRVKSRYAIRRFSRTWKLDGDGHVVNAEGTLQSSAANAKLPNGWGYDSTFPIEDWIDNAALPQFTKWEPRGVLDEFLVGVVDTKATDPAGVELNKGRAGAFAAAADFPDDSFFTRVAGQPEFQYRYVAHWIELRPFEGHPMVFRVSYASAGPFSLEEFKSRYRNVDPNVQWSWGGAGGWREIVKKGKGWKVVDFTPPE